MAILSTPVYKIKVTGAPQGPEAKGPLKKEADNEQKPQARAGNPIMTPVYGIPLSGGD